MKAMHFSLPAWDQIPDLGLYMDQVILFVQRCYVDLYGTDEMTKLITPSMVNNYTKAGLIARPVGKKYTREQMACILMIVFLKSVLSMDSIGRLLHTEDIQTLYAVFCDRQKKAMQAFEEQSAMAAAVDSAMYAVASVHMLSSEEEE